MRPFLPLLALGACLVLWLWLFVAEGAFANGPDGKALGADYTMFLNGARLLAQGMNPYNHALLLHFERTWLAQRGLAMAKPASIRVGNPPLFFWTLRPLAAVPFAAGALAWVAAMYALALGGLLALFRTFRWRVRPAPVLFFAAMPQTVLGPFYGNVVDVVFAGICVALLLAETYPLVAGGLLAVAWLKPPVALPLVLLILLFSARWRSIASGFCGATALGVLVTLGTTGPHSLVEWVQGLSSYSRDIASSPSVASLSGLYVRVAPPTIRTLLEAIVLLCALATTLVVRYRRGQPPTGALAVPALWILWLLATPYAHIYDEILLTIPVMVIVGRNGAAARSGAPLGMLYALFSCLVVIQMSIGGVQLLPIPLVAAFLLAWNHGRTPTSDAPTTRAAVVA